MIKKTTNRFVSYLTKIKFQISKDQIFTLKIVIVHEPCGVNKWYRKLKHNRVDLQAITDWRVVKILQKK